MSAILLLTLTACTDVGLTSLSALDELTLSAASSKEEVLLDGEDAAAAAMPEHEAPPPFAECDAAGRFASLQASYDGDGDGALDEDEAAAVLEARADRGDPAERHLRGLWHMLGLVYDLDESGELDEAERATLLDDMTVRCDAIQARLLAEFDADGDGTLDPTEQATAEAELQAAFEEGHQGTCPGMAGGQGAPPEQPEPGAREVPPPLAAYDTDGDGLFSDAELAALREAVRAELRAGDPMVDAFGH